MNGDIGFELIDIDGSTIIESDNFAVMYSDGSTDYLGKDDEYNTDEDYIVLLKSGLFDKKGNNIKNGDILLVDDSLINFLKEGNLSGVSKYKEPNNRIVVVYERGSFRYYTEDELKGSDTFNRDCIGNFDTERAFEVVGNIFKK